MKKDNRGLTLIELIVVIAIMAIMIAVSGFSLSMISHKRVSNNALSIKQAIQIAQTYNKSQGNTDDVAQAAAHQRNAANANDRKIADMQRANGLCKLKIVGTTDDSKYPYMYIYIADKVSDLNDDSKCRIADGSKGVIRLEKKTTIKVQYADGTEITIGKGDWADIRLARTTGGFINSNYKVGGANGNGVPVKIIVTDSDRTVTLNLATYTGVVTKD